MKHILFLDHYNKVGGAQLFLLDIMRAINTNNFKLYTVTPIDENVTQKLCEIKDIEIVSFKFSKVKTINFFSHIKNIYSYFLLLKLIPNKKIDIIFCNSTFCQIYGIFLKLYFKKPLFFYVHDPFLPKIFLKMLIYKVDKTITNSNYMKNKLLKIGLLDRNVEIIPPHIIEQNEITYTSKELFLSELYLNKEDLIVAIFGRLVPWKGHMLLIESIPKILDIIPNAKFLFVGSEEKRYSKKLKILIHKKSLDNYIKFIGYRKDVLNIMSLCDIIVNCSIKPEPFGRTLVEAGILGKPAVAFNYGGPPDIVINKKTGFLVKPLDVDELSKAIIQLLESKHLRDTFGCNASNTMKEYFNFSKTVKKIEFVLGVR